ncbi:myo-inositol 2-dehydrogenase/D-chiro-inositol 1-dehydrogenase [Mycoplasmoides fastidiosum]|uniref:Myo-inositol 2-dehydrogenase/D-chiro-inositol 1-dehydrogenase n=1 Tax=Mycoplasmoides fastidiosum TaxID=92758 RepID=A0ABU0LZH9_9BACT|nr:inositol 2-dehydrogenase [Mycoplasmoides fastidiosum]MDQ0514115.1 myo-inositol 2-dehydrogenase/D-chiro-inositol 1-dehydrogenase [Mycoplasmoides fastidiosum]UUD37477.1 inositol 2-dehydrogenase [Mycoplasmoides fastidiosum]
MNQQLQVAILGGGRIAYVHAKAITFHVPNAQVKWIYDPYLNPTTQARFTELGINHFTKTLTDVLADPEVDVVYICTPTPTHADYAIQALDAQKHVFCEKPISFDLATINLVQAAIIRNQKKFMVGHNRRFDHNFQAVKQALNEEVIGSVFQIKITSRDPGLPPLEYLVASGNLFYDMMIHDLDMARFLSPSPITKVFAYGAGLVNPELVKQVNDLDSAVVVLICENQSMIIIDNCRQASYGYDQRVEILGATGQLQIGNDHPNTLVVSSATGINHPKPLHFFLERYMQAYIAESISFFAAITHDQTPAVTVNDGFSAILLAAAATLSWQENRVVELKELSPSWKQ